ncbi:hypothetical protein C3B58_07670 [Lactonifactor longoviformis]|uniref:Uncharacterized protein n=1 Tax=Lactonifactor longoviformis DSM 17459 TaxID=1122155 RepID=A0A1M5DDM5_9CLOT|nr:hypothetical protein [Lactonifactor longoviformis]POP33371.1 hypothetical protein C3B58_07670 [Lactonifactor longoviformis]SHF65087.1 hypothetical protein SAMN02745158_04507 [Lactonifactor longoviformis DSM 17459]
MKKIERREIEKQVKKEYAAARDWCSYDHFRYYKMMIDTSDGDIWSDVFLSENEWKVYHSETIMSLENYYYGTIKEKEAEYIEDAIRKLKSAGWEIV